MSLRNILLVVVGLLLVAALYKHFSSGKKDTPPTTNGPNVTAPAPATNTPAAAPIRTPQASGDMPRRPGPNDSYGIVREYMSKITSLPLPKGYEVPEYISTLATQEEVFEEFAVRHPSFYGFGSTQLLDSIRANPAEYEVMLNENKAIRNRFDPNSNY